MTPCLAFFDAYDGWIILAGVCCNTACAMLGCYLVLRRMSLMGDAISHAILPGIAIAFIITGSRNILPMLAGALAVGVLTAVASQALHRWGRVPEDAAMGVVFTSLFALGVLMINQVAHGVDLDPGCVLYGSIETTPDFKLVIGDWVSPVPHRVVVLAAVLVVDLILVGLFYKELLIVSFDPFLAGTMGINAAVVHYGLMAAVSGTCVAAFESVGSILVVAMLIVPGATAQLLTDRLRSMLLVAAGVAVTSSVVGYWIAAYVVDTPAAGMMAVVAGGQFLLAVFFAPRHGFLSKKIHQAALSLRILRQDVLGMLYRWQEAGRSDTLTDRQIVAALGGGRLAKFAVRSAVRSGLALRTSGGAIGLSDAGAAQARGLVRAHRLWEAYLNKHFGLPLDHLHAPAERMEHYVSPEMQSQLERETRAAADPHGRRIPEPAD